MKLFCLKVVCDYKAQFEFQMRFPLPFKDWRAHSILLLRYDTGRRRIEWEVWRWASTPETNESMAALSQTRAAMLWSVTQKYDLSKPPLVTSGPTLPSNLWEEQGISSETQIEPYNCKPLSSKIASSWCIWTQLDLTPWLPFSLICLLSPDHNWHIYVL